MISIVWRSVLNCSHIIFLCHLHGNDFISTKHLIHQPIIDNLLNAVKLLNRAFYCIINKWSLISYQVKMLVLNSICCRSCIFSLINIYLKWFACFSVLLLGQVAVNCHVRYLSTADETSHVLKRPKKMFAHVQALCFILKMIFITAESLSSSVYLLSPTLRFVWLSHIVLFKWKH